jgi:pentapeptide repeat protein
MNPAVVAAIIAASVSVITLIGTLAAQSYSIRKTSSDTAKTREQQEQQLDRTLAEQRGQLDRTLAEQREQLDRTLTEQSKQLDRTLAEQRTRTLNERFATAADRLGSDKPPAVQLAGVYAMAGLADDWEENRQTCVDVLCAYLRMPYEPDPGEDSPEPERLAFRASREVRHTVIRVITAHLKDDAAVSWQGLNFDFTGVVFDGGDFSDAKFSGGMVRFNHAEFSGGTVNFNRAGFSGGTVWFSRARFSGGDVQFVRAEFSGGDVIFLRAEFSGGDVSFGGARFSGGHVSFLEAKFSGGTVSFSNAEFSAERVSFGQAIFSGGEVDFSSAGDWSCPPQFSWAITPPPGVMLPEKKINPRRRRTPT